MAAITLEGLPRDVQAPIAELLWEASPSSLAALARTSRTLHDIAVPLLYKYLAIDVSTRAKLAADVRCLKSTQLGQRYLRHARHIKLTGCLISAASEAENLDANVKEDPDEWDEWRPPQDDKFLIAGANFSVDGASTPYFNEVFVADPNLDDRDSDVAAWRPFIGLLGEFERLSDLVWEAYKRFPPGLVDGLHLYHPDCRIHLRRYRFLSLHDAETDPEELALVNSPCLHSLSLLTVYRDSNGKDDYNEAAGLRVLTAAPRIKHFTILGARPASSPQLARARGTPIDVWNGFKPEPERMQKAMLETFSTLCYSDTLSIKRLGVLEQHMMLKSLKQASFSVSDADILMRLTSEDMFESLEVLSITLKRSKSDDRFETVAETFFLRLPSLVELDLSGTVHRQLLTNICHRHGATLQKLAIQPYEDHYSMAGPPLMLEAEDFEDISRHCPKLGSVKITLKRTKGDNRETRCYEAMGRLKGLREAEIHLDCSNTPPSNRSLGGSGDPATLEQALINSAIDETLARSIWDILAGARTHQGLETLRITSGGGSSFGNSHPGDLMTIVSHMSRSYVIKCRFIDGAREVDIVETNREAREERDERQREHELTMIEKWGTRGLNGSAYHAMNRLWGLDDGYGNWTDAWKSFPLQRSVQ